MINIIGSLIIIVIGLSLLWWVLVRDNIEDKKREARMDSFWQTYWDAVISSNMPSAYKTQHCIAIIREEDDMNLMTYKLDIEAQEIKDMFEAGLLKSVPNVDAEKQQLIQAAKAMNKKENRMKANEYIYLTALNKMNEEVKTLVHCGKNGIGERDIFFISKSLDEIVDILREHEIKERE